MANRFWVGGTSTWNSSNTTCWSTTSGGPHGASVPTAAEGVVFDANSTGFAGVVTLAGNPICKTLNLTGFKGAFASAGVALSVFGAVVLGGKSLPQAVTLDLEGSGLLTSNGGSILGALTVGVSEVVAITLADDLSVGLSLGFYSGSFDAGGHNVTAKSVGTTAPLFTISLGAGTWTLTGSGTPWSAAGAIINPSTSTIKFTDTSANSKKFDGGGKVYNNLWFSGDAGISFYEIAGSNTFNNIRMDNAPQTIKFDQGTTTTIKSLTISGTINDQMTLASEISHTGSSSWNLVATSGNITVNYCMISDSIASGGAKFTANNSDDAGGNSGWTFPGGASNRGLLAFF